MNLMNRKTIVGFLLMALIVGAAVWLAGERRPAAAQAAAVAQPPIPVTPAAQVSADGYVTPARHAVLSAAVPGRVTQVHVVEGQAVAAGALVATLENKAQQASVAQAQANLAQAQAWLAQIKAGARPEEIAQAAAAVTAAQARLERLQHSPTPEQVASAQAAVAVAQANLARAQAGPTPEQLNAAEAVVQAAAAAVEQAQAAYDKVTWRSDVAALPQSVQLQQATIEYERAAASYRNLAAGATAAEIEVYRQQAVQAQAALAEVQAGAHPAELAAAEAELARAQASLAQVRAGARVEEIAAAQAQAEAAEAELARVQASLELTLVRAPFAGVVSALEATAGEYVAPGQPLAWLGDAETWLVETDNLSELDVFELAPGDRVIVTFDAWPGQTVGGTVQQIQPVGQLKRGTVTFQVTVTLDETDLPLYWGLTALVTKP